MSGLIRGSITANTRAPSMGWPAGSTTRPRSRLPRASWNADNRLVRVGRHCLCPGHITFSRRRQEKTLPARQMEMKATFRVGGMTPGEFGGSESPGRIFDPGAGDRSPPFVDHPAFQRQALEKDLAVGLVAELREPRRTRRPSECRCTVADEVGMNQSKLDLVGARRHAVSPPPAIGPGARRDLVIILGASRVCGSGSRAVTRNGHQHVAPSTGRSAAATTMPPIVVPRRSRKVQASGGPGLPSNPQPRPIGT